MRAFPARTVCFCSLLCIVLLPGCSSDDPVPSDLGADDSSTASCSISWALPDIAGNNDSCKPEPDDYDPGADDDNYEACISDDDAYHPFEESISSIGRVAGFEKIVDLLLLDDGKAPDKQAFVDARLAYTEPEGLDSRVSRREDEHYPASDKKCADMTADELEVNLDRCVGQAQIQPLLNAAFADGSEGNRALLNAARIEAALLWFLYVSTYKEATTCTDTRKDCDSSYAYYTGGEPRSRGLGLARYVRVASTQAHDAVWDGILAVRCWRDLDAAVPAEDLALRDRALRQLDRALLRGLTAILKSRLAAIDAAECDEASQALWAGVQILGAALDREATERDSNKAKTLRGALSSKTVGDTTVIADTLDDLFPCP